ncbi:unnamed protein product, partial [Laminaria digitata]
MAQTKTQNVDELIGVVRRGAKRLDARAVAALASHPNAVISALAVTADALGIKTRPSRDIEAIGGTTSMLIDEAQVQERFDARTKVGREVDLLSSDELAQRAGIKTRQSVHDWLKKGRIIGWEGAKRGYVFPAGQLDKRGRPIKGIDKISGLFPDGYAAWSWLTIPLRALDCAMPLDLLRKGDFEQVVAAAEG